MPKPLKCSNCERELGDGDLYVYLELREARSDLSQGSAVFGANSSRMRLCLVCYDDNWRLVDPDCDDCTGPNFYTTERHKPNYDSQKEAR